MLHLRPRLLQYPAKRQLDILHQMTGDLDVSDICRVVKRPNVVVLQDAGGVEVVYKPFSSAFVQAAVVEISDDILDLMKEARALHPGVADLAEARPETQDDDLGLGPASVDFVDELNITGVELLMRNVVGSIVVIRPEVHHSDIGWWVGIEIPVRNIWPVSVDLESSSTRVGDLEPLVCLSMQVPIAAAFVQTDSRVCCDAEFDVTETVHEPPAVAGDAFQSCVLTCGERVAYELHGACVIWDLDQSTGAARYVDMFDLDSVGLHFITYHQRMCHTNVILRFYMPSSSLAAQRSALPLSAL